MTPKKWKNGPQKLLIISPDPFFSQSSPDQRPTAQNWFFILWNLRTRHLVSYLCHITTGTPKFFDFPPCLYVCKKRFVEKTNLSNSNWDVKLFTVSRRCLPLNKVDMAFVVRQMCYMLLYANLRLIEETQVGTYRRKEKIT